MLVIRTTTSTPTAKGYNYFFLGSLERYRVYTSARYQEPGRLLLVLLVFTMAQVQQACHILDSWSL
jgi:hypothetical protein